MELYTHHAIQDLIDIFDYIHEQSGSLEIASRYIDEIETVCILMEEQPYIGRLRPEVGKGVRSFPVRSHIVLYRVFDGQPQVARVLHGSRDITEKLLS